MDPRFATAALLLGALVACSPATEAPPTEARGEAAPPAASAQAGPAPAASAQGDCDLFSSDELREAFAGQLSARRASGRGGRGSGCTYSLAEVSESELVLQAGDQAAFDARKQAYSSQSGLGMEPLDIGREAWLVNGAQVIAVREDGASVSLGLMMITFNQPAPVSDEQVRDGLVQLSRLALERL